MSSARLCRQVWPKHFAMPKLFVPHSYVDEQVEPLRKEREHRAVKGEAKPAVVVENRRRIGSFRAWNALSGVGRAKTPAGGRVSALVNVAPRSR